MRLFLVTAALAAALLVVSAGPVAAQDNGDPAAGLKPDLPLEKPMPETADDPEEDDDGDESGEVPGEGPPQEKPPEEDPPQNPPPEFFDEPIEEAEVIFVIDRTGSMRWPSKMSVVDESGNPVNNAKKYEVARIELIKAISNLSENIKFAMVGFSTRGCSSSSRDTNWASGGGGQIGGRWRSWPPKYGEPSPLGYHMKHGSNIPVWPSSKELVTANADNKASATSWAQQRLSGSHTEVSGGTCTHDGMSAALKMVSAAPPGKGPGGEPKKSATAIYLLTDGAPTHIEGVAYCLCRVYGSYDAGEVANDGTWTLTCMDLTKSKILAENVHHATIYTLGMGMNMAHPNAYVWNPGKMNWDVHPTAYNDHCRKFLTELAEATGGHYREVSQ
jgi:hypothetical protein